MQRLLPHLWQLGGCCGAPRVAELAVLAVALAPEALVPPVALVARVGAFAKSLAAPSQL